MQEERFTLKKSTTGTLIIRDTSNKTMVCTFCNVGRPFEYTQRMAQTMLEALNAAARGQGGKE